MTIARRVRVSGGVQGVGFRAAARAEARRQSLTGWAHNEADGTVLIAVEGDADAVEAFIAWCAQGPVGARVERVEVTAAKPEGWSGFATG
jgi:acylphosphatase